MSSKEELRHEREKKLALFTERGIPAYPAKTMVTHTVLQVQEEFAILSENKTVVTVAGRLMSIRRHGGSTFADIFDGTGRTQLFFSKETLGEESYGLLTDAVDASDFLEVTGDVFETNRGAQTIRVTEWRMLTKALQAVPSEFYGLEDEEERFRKRYLDLLQNGELRALFVKKAEFWDSVRGFMKSRGFLEVETPTLEVTTGGAEARPFKTHHNDFDMDVYLRISIGELWQKRLMAAGFPKTFEIGRAYRNEGTSPEHLQEFTNMEFYWAYADYREGMVLVQDLYRTIAKDVFGTTKFTARGHTFDLSDEWTLIDYGEEIKKQTGIDIHTATDADMEVKLRELGVKYEGKNRERLMDTLWKHCRKNIAGPAFLVHHPLLVAPLAKARADGNTVEMFQPIIAGSEVGRGYSELNDPVDQRKRFEVQQALLEGGDEEAMMPEWEFVDMLEYGMPPTCGFGFGERFFAFLMDKPLREVQLFPLMRPRNEEKIPVKSEGKEVAVVIIDTVKLKEGWQILNTVAHVSASFAARTGKKLFYADYAMTSDNYPIPLNIQNAIMIKKGENLERVMYEHPASCVVVPFTREMIETTNDKKVITIIKEKTKDDIEYLGVLIFGPRSEVEAYTEKYPLYS